MHKPSKVHVPGKVPGDAPPVYSQNSAVWTSGDSVPETESYTLHAAELVLKQVLQRIRPGDSDSRGPRPLRIIDLCTGTGCIALLLHALLATHFQRMVVVGVDISPAAIGLANRNLEHNLQLGLLSNRALSEIKFHRGNVLGNQGDGIPSVEEVLQNDTLMANGNSEYDVLISNPPYISPTCFHDGTTARSVRIFEPTIALVPTMDMRDFNNTTICNQGDYFYHFIIALSFKLRIKLTILECGDYMQAERVVALCRDLIGKEKRHHELLVEVYPSDYTEMNLGESYSWNNACAVIIRETDKSL
ncbi:Methyltransferase [Aspergillus sclerotialis]|uniref:Methyltransferase n=1 Tax=Aspergillus sclerotialis TaxID=2070753 RepID=A0A3A2ZVY9_9EURO|nr:Methyltransferase [Aspergillus sclerotialis]